MTEMRIPKPSEIPCNKTIYIGRLKIRGTKPLDSGIGEQVKQKDHKKPSRKDDQGND